jgi:hypothetical protein
MVLAPGRLSTITLVPRSSPSFCATTRACPSVPPPAVKPTTMRMGLPLTGKSCAPASGESASSAPPSSSAKARRNAAGCRAGDSSDVSISMILSTRIIKSYMI